MGNKKGRYYAKLILTQIRSRFIRIRCKNFSVGRGTIIGKNVLVENVNGDSITIGNYSKFCQGKIRISKNGSIDIGEKTSFEGADVQANGGRILIGESTFMNKEATIVSLEEVRIGKNCAFGPHVTIYDHDHVYECGGRRDWSKYKSSPIIIEDNVWVGANVTILRNTVIGNNCVIGAGSVVKGNIPPNTIVRPAQCLHTQI